ncbi:MAG: APC family permease [Mycoplasmatales bacterium]
MKEVQEKFGLPTVISMVVGIVIGSGIFFKADDILITTQGSVTLGIIGFILIGVGVLFGALVVSNYANESSDEGGIIKYSQMVLGKRYGFTVGWFFATVYFPALLAILSWVFGIYVTSLFGIKSTTILWVITVGVCAFAMITNYFATRATGALQSVVTIIKLVPLVLVVIYGVFFGNFSGEVANQSLIPSGATTGFLPALLSIAFAFDGWIVATAIAAEVKDAKKIVGRALAIGTIVIVCVYVLYFYGMTKLVGVNQIMELGDSHVSQASQIIFGNPSIITAFVCISVYGGINGMVLAYMRFPHALVANGMMKDSMGIGKINPKYDLSLMSVLFCIPFVLIYMVIHFLSTNGEQFPNWFASIGFDISLLPILIVTVFYLVLFIGLIPRISKAKLSPINYFYVVIASAVALITIYGSLGINGVLYISCSAVVMIIGQLFYNNKNEKKM